jgi:hypothetical protein
MAESIREELIEESEHDRMCPGWVKEPTIGERRISFAAWLKIPSLRTKA